MSISLLQKSEERSVAVAVRIHRTLELAVNKFYIIISLLQKSEERSVAVAVRIHRTLELADDKFYMITCGKAGFQVTLFCKDEIFYHRQVLKVSKWPVLINNVVI
jgi:hypothetical protein